MSHGIIPELKRMSATLKAFWQHFRGRGNQGRGFNEAENLMR
jgi:hypothetical protein